MRQLITLNKLAKIMTLITVILLLGTVSYLSYEMFYGNPLHNILYICLISIVLGAIIVSFIFAPKAIVVTGNELIIHKTIGHKTIKLNDILTIELYNGSSNDIRLFGSGGLFGFYGIFRNSEKGNYTAYVGDFSTAFYITLTAGKTYLVSCEDRKTMMNYIKARIK